MRPVHLPAVGVTVTLRSPTGIEDMMLLEAPPITTIEAELALSTALAERLAVVPGDAAPIDWSDVPITDLDMLLLRLRQTRIGDRVHGDVACLAIDCAERIQISFGIDEFLDYARSQTSVPVPSAVHGWFDVPRSGDGVRFRLPTPRDIVASARTAKPIRSLAARCIHPPAATDPQRRRAERAMEAIAPLGVRLLRGDCPACGATVTAYFDIRRFCLRELRDQAIFIYDDIDSLARSYHWSEGAILSLGADRRARYASRARSAMPATA
jgi:hypothetical protein